MAAATAAASDQAAVLLLIGTEVSAKYRGAFCEARIKHVEKLVKCKVMPKEAIGVAFSVTDDDVKGPLKIGSAVEAKHPHTGLYVECTLLKITDASTYTVVFDDGDVVTLRRTQLCLKGDKHFLESETLDQLPLTHPEHFGTPVMQGTKKERRRRSGFGASTSSQCSEDDDDNSEDDGGRPAAASASGSTPGSSAAGGRQTAAAAAASSAAAADKSIGRVVLISQVIGDKKKWFPALVVLPGGAEGDGSKAKDVVHVKSFKDSKVHVLSKKETKDYVKESPSKCDIDKSTRLAFDRASQYAQSKVLPPSWNKKDLLGIADSGDESDSDDDEDDADDASEPPELRKRRQAAAADSESSSDGEHTEEKDRFVAQLYKYMDDSGTPINKAPRVNGRELNLYDLFYAVRQRGGYNKTSSTSKWKGVASDMGLAGAANPLKRAYKQYLLSFEDFYRKMGDMTHFESGGRHGRAAAARGSGSGPSSCLSSPTSGSGGRNVLPPKERELSAAANATASPAGSAVARVADGNSKTVPGATPSVSTGSAAGRLTAVDGGKQQSASGVSAPAATVGSSKPSGVSAKASESRSDTTKRDGPASTPKRPAGEASAPVASVRLGRDAATEAKVQPLMESAARSPDRRLPALAKADGSAEKEFATPGSAVPLRKTPSGTAMAQRLQPPTTSPQPPAAAGPVTAEQGAGRRTPSSATEPPAAGDGSSGTSRRTPVRGARRDDAAATSATATPVSSSQLKKEPVEKRESSPRVRPDSPRGAPPVTRPGSRGSAATSGKNGDGRVQQPDVGGGESAVGRSRAAVKQEPTAEKRKDEAAVVPSDDQANAELQKDGQPPKKRSRRSSSKLEVSIVTSSSAEGTPKTSTSIASLVIVPLPQVGKDREDTLPPPATTASAASSSAAMDKADTGCLTPAVTPAALSDSGGLSTVAGAVTVEVDYPPGSRLKVRYGRGKAVSSNVYEAKVNEVVVEESGQLAYFVHYAGWNNRYDEWVKLDRIIGPFGKVEKKKMAVPRVSASALLKKKGAQASMRPVDSRSAADAGGSPGSGSGGASPNVRASTPGLTRSSLADAGGSASGASSSRQSDHSPQPPGLERCSSSPLSEPPLLADDGTSCAASSAATIEELAGVHGGSTTVQAAAPSSGTAQPLTTSSAVVSSTSSTGSAVCPEAEATHSSDAGAPSPRSSSSSSALAVSAPVTKRAPLSRSPRGNVATVEIKDSGVATGACRNEREKSSSPEPSISPPRLRSPGGTCAIEAAAAAADVSVSGDNGRASLVGSAIKDEPAVPLPVQSTAAGDASVPKLEIGESSDPNEHTSSSLPVVAASSSATPGSLQQQQQGERLEKTVSQSAVADRDAASVVAAATAAVSLPKDGSAAGEETTEAAVELDAAACQPSSPASPRRPVAASSGPAEAFRSAGSATVQLAPGAAVVAASSEQPMDVVSANATVATQLAAAATNTAAHPMANSSSNDSAAAAAAAADGCSGGCGTESVAAAPGNAGDDDSGSDTVDKKQMPPVGQRRRQRRSAVSPATASSVDGAASSAVGTKDILSKAAAAGFAAPRRGLPLQRRLSGGGPLGSPSATTGDVCESLSQESGPTNGGSSEEDEKDSAVASSVAVVPAARKRKADQLHPVEAEDDETSGKRSSTSAVPGPKRRRQPARKKTSDEPGAASADDAAAESANRVSPSSPALSPRAEAAEPWREASTVAAAPVAGAGILPAIAGRPLTAGTAVAAAAPGGDASSLASDAAKRSSGGDALLWLSEAAAADCPTASSVHGSGASANESAAIGEQAGGSRLSSPQWHDESAAAGPLSMDRAAGDGGSSAAEKSAAAAAATGKLQRRAAALMLQQPTAAAAGAITPAPDNGNGGKVAAATSAAAARRSAKLQQQNQQALSLPLRGPKRALKSAATAAGRTAQAAPASDQDESSNQEAANLGAGSALASRQSPQKKPSCDSGSKSPRQPRYNFDIRDELSKISDKDKRIAFIYSKMCEVRRLYAEQRNELQELDRRRKKRASKMVAAGVAGRAPGSATPSTKADQGASALLSLSSPVSLSSSSSQQGINAINVSACVATAAHSRIPAS